MNHTKEAREVKQSHYGGYRNWCRKLNIVPVPYHSFNMDEYNRVKIRSKTFPGIAKAMASQWTTSEDLTVQTTLF